MSTDGDCSNFCMELQARSSKALIARKKLISSLLLLLSGPQLPRLRKGSQRLCYQRRNSMTSAMSKRVWWKQCSVVTMCFSQALLPVYVVSESRSPKPTEERMGSLSKAYFCISVCFCYLLWFCAVQNLQPCARPPWLGKEFRSEAHHSSAKGFREGAELILPEVAEWFTRAV